MTSEANLVLPVLRNQAAWKEDAGMSAISLKRDPILEPWRLTSAIGALSAQSLWHDAVLLLCHSRRSRLHPSTICCNAGMAACQKGLSWSVALSLFVMMCTDVTRPDIISLNTCIGSSRKGFWRTGLALLKPASCSTLKLDCFTLTSLLSGCRSNWRLSRIILADLCLANGMQPTTQVCNAHLTATSKQPWALSLHSVAETSQTTDHVTFKLVAGSLVQSGIWEECAALLQFLRSWRCHEQAMPLASLVNAFGREILWSRAVYIMSSFEKDLGACSAAASACEKASIWKQALGLSSLLAESGLRSDIVCWNVNLSGLASASKWTEALGTFRAAAKSSLKPDVATFGATVEAAATGGQWAVLLVLLSRRSRKIDAAACSTALHGLAGNPWRAGTLVLEAAVRDALRPDLGNYASLLSALPSQAWQKGVQSLPQLVTMNALQALHSPSYLSLSAALFQSLGECQNWSTALVLFSFLQRYEMLSSSVLANAMASLQAAGRRKQALDLCRRAQKDAVQLDTASLSVVLSLCDRADFWENSLRFLSDWSGQLDEVTLGAAVGSCSKGHQWPFCASLLQSMQAPGSKSLVAINSLIDAAAKSSDWHVALYNLVGIAHNGLEPDLTSVNSALPGFNTQDWMRAITVTSRLLQRQQPDAITAMGLLAMFEEASCWTRAAPLLDELGSKAAMFESRSQAMACMDHLLYTDKLHVKISQMLYRLVLAPAIPILSVMHRSELDESPPELQVYSFGAHFTDATLSQLRLTVTSAFWLPMVRRETRRVSQPPGAIRTQQVATARLVTASAAHSICPQTVRQRSLGHRGEGVENALHARLIPIFVEHDRSLHAERHALLAILFDLRFRWSEKRLLLCCAPCLRRFTRSPPCGGLAAEICKGHNQRQWFLPYAC